MMSKEKKIQELKELVGGLHLLIDTIKQCGNKNWKDHPLVQNYVKDIKKLQEELGGE